MPGWTTKDIRLLLQWWEEGVISSHIARRLRRTNGAVRCKLWELRKHGVGSMTARRLQWTGAEVRLLKHYRDKGKSALYIATLLGRSREAVYRKARSLGLTRERREIG